MKKFMKFCLITSLVLVLLGLVVTAGAAAAGGLDLVREVLHSGAAIFHHRTPAYLVEDFGDWAEDWDDSEGTGELQGVQYAGEWDERTASGAQIGAGASMDMTDGLHTEIGDGGLAVFAGEGLAGLQIDLIGGRLSIRKGEGSDLKVTMKTGRRTVVDRIECFLDGENAVLRDYRAPRLSAYNDRVVYVDIPEGMRLENVRISLGGGEVTAEELNADYIKLQADAGSIKVKQLLAERLDYSINAGEGLIQSGEIGTGHMSVDAGRIRYKGSVASGLSGDCAMGELAIRLAGGEEDYDYNLSSSAGQIRLGGATSTGLGVERKINNGTGKMISLNCDMGSIEIDFED